MDASQRSVSGPLKLELDAPAKLNLGLRVVGQRPDGYHLLESLFVPIDLCDRLSVEVELGAPASTHAEIELELLAPQARPEEDSGPGIALAEDLPTDERNLAVRAARAFLTACPDGSGSAQVARIEIRLEKRIPSAAGLGGGSSDAGAVLRALSQLLPGTVGEAELARLALSLGADVPFFLDPRPSRVSGIGERIDPVSGLPPLWLLVANPGLSVSTAEVFRLRATLSAKGSALTPSEAAPTIPALFGSGSDPTDGLPGSAMLATLASLISGGNDLESAAIRLCPPIARLRDRLSALGAIAAGMSGSGASVYGLFSDEAEARGALEKAGFGEPTWARVVRSLC